MKITRRTNFLAARAPDNMMRGDAERVQIPEAGTGSLSASLCIATWLSSLSRACKSQFLERVRYININLVLLSSDVSGSLLPVKSVKFQTADKFKSESIYCVST